MSLLAQLYDSSASPADYALKYLGRVAELLKKIDGSVVAKVIDLIEEASRRGSSVFCMGNGGSAAVASHFVNDLAASRLVEGKPGIRAFSLTDNVESVTAIANDTGFENIFSHQLRTNMRSGDVVIAMSASGNSENIIRAVRYAREHGGHTVGWCGFNGGRLPELCDLTIHIPTTHDEYGPVEAIFLHLTHIVSGYLTMSRGRRLSQGNRGEQ